MKTVLNSYKGAYVSIERFKKEMSEAHAKNKALLELAKTENRVFTEDEQADFDKNQKIVNDCSKQIQNITAVEAMDTLLTTPVNDSSTPPAGGAMDKGEKVYATMTEFMADVKKAASGQVSEKLTKLQNSLGMNEGVGTDGGYMVQSDFAGLMLETAIKESLLLQRIDTYSVTAGSNRVAWVDVDEQDVSNDAVCGGVKMYWASEAQAVEATKPKLQEKELKLEKLMGICYTTDELDSDSNFTEQFIQSCFSKATQRALTAAVVDGDGKGKPTGILKGKGVVTASKESGQAANTIVWENITEMYHTALDADNGTYVWLVHPDAHKQFDSFKVEVGTGGVPVYQPAAMAGAVPLLRGIPVIPTDHCSALGTKGDIILADLSDYIMPTKDSIRKDVSMHVQFLTAQNAYRFILRANGRPRTSSALKIKNSSVKRGKYVVLETRA
jgi:HK97 family phage major capsid protein